MTFADDFQPGGGEEIGGGQGQKIFGITMTPTVGGIAAAVVGVVVAFYCWSTFVTPVQEEVSNLERELETVNSQIQQSKSGEIPRKLQSLQQEQARLNAVKAQVLALFADKSSMETLLLDINNIVKAKNGKITSFVPKTPEVVKDESLGPLVTNKLKRQNIELSIEGTFEQVMPIMQDIERMQPLLLVKNFSSSLSDKEPPVEVSVIRINNTSPVTAKRVVLGKTPDKLQVSMQLQAILPLTPEEQAKLAPPPPPPATAEGQAPPATPPAK